MNNNNTIQPIFSIIVAILAFLLPFNGCSAQNNITLLKPKKLSNIGVLPGNYSGITNIVTDTFAIVSDKPDSQGCIVKYFKIEQSPKSGIITHIKEIKNNNIHKNSLLANRDCEDIIYNKHTQTFFICGENDQEILEYDKDFTPTKQGLNIPSIFAVNNIKPNKGFEALAFNPIDTTYWTITESNLKTDTNLESQRIRLRLQRFNKYLIPDKLFIYETEEPIYNSKYKGYAFGVPAITFLNDSSILIIERELRVKKSFIGSSTTIHLFAINPNDTCSNPINSNLSNLSQCNIIPKKKIGSFTTHLRFGRMNFANYEGVCLGRKLDDGRQTIILISDSQNGSGNIFYKAKDYLKVIILD